MAFAGHSKESLIQYFRWNIRTFTLESLAESNLESNWVKDTTSERWNTEKSILLFVWGTGQTLFPVQPLIVGVINEDVAQSGDLQYKCLLPILSLNDHSLM